MPVTLVTGAAQGIGEAIARRLSVDGPRGGDGTRIAVNDIRPSPSLDKLAAEIDGFVAVADVSDREQVRAVVSRIEHDHGPVSTLVCNAAYMTMSPFLDHAPEDWWKIIDTNLSGTFHLIQAVLPGMRAQGHGRIVIVTSYWGVTGWPNATGYAASKSGLIALTKTLGRELAPEGIIVNAIAPGVIATPQLDVDAADAGLNRAEIERRYAENVPLGRIGQPEEIAAAVAFLASPRVGAMVGTVLQVNGGELRCRA